LKIWFRLKNVLACNQEEKRKLKNLSINMLTPSKKNSKMKIFVTKSNVKKFFHDAFYFSERKFSNLVFDKKFDKKFPRQKG